MTERVALWILGCFGLLHVLTFFRDFAIREGWITESSWGYLGAIARNAGSGYRHQVTAVLAAIGFGPLIRTEIRRAADSAASSRLRRQGEVSLSRELLANLRERAKHLESPFYYGGKSYYIDSMGASSYVPEREVELAHLLVRWVVGLEHERAIDPFDAVIAVKDGNVCLALQYCAYATKPIILCKGKNDGARIARPFTGSPPHDTDFEGLEALLRERRRDGTPDAHLNVLAVDDSCRGGSTLVEAMRTFNELVEQKQYPFNHVKHAVVLFTIKDQHTRQNFSKQGFELHSLVSLGDLEIQQLMEAKTRVAKDALLRNVASFKADYGCEWSRKLDC